MTLSKKTTHVSEAILNLIAKFTDQPNFQAMITALVNQVQEVENALFELIDERTLDTAVGVQLDGIGSILGEDREGKSDSDYRTALRARILLNIGSGTPEELIEMVSLLTGSKNNELTEYHPAALTIFVLGALTFTEASNVNAALQSGKPAGVLAHLIYGESPTAELFQYDLGPGYDQGKWATILNPDFVQFEIVERSSGDFLKARDEKELIAR
jgi:hypothetical protein